MLAELLFNSAYTLDIDVNLKRQPTARLSIALGVQLTHLF